MLFMEKILYPIFHTLLLTGIIGLIVLYMYGSFLNANEDMELITALLICLTYAVLPSIIVVILVYKRYKKDLL